MREVEPAAWDGVLAELGITDAYYRRAYVESACVLEPGRPVLLEHGGTAMPVIVREFEGTVPARREQSPPVPERGQSPRARDAITPYGYGGPVGSDPFSYWPAYDEWARENGLVTTFVRFHPLYANRRAAPFHVEGLTPTIAWRLDGDLLARMHGKHRNAVRKGQAAGIAVEAGTGLGGFVPLYEETMRRANADAFYFFPATYWQALDRLGEALVRFDAFAEADVVASATCLATPPWLHYHLGATAERGRKLGATTVLLYEIARWAQERRYELFHLGGGVGGKRDSLHEFKRRFDPDGEVDVAIGKLVHDAAAYRELGGDPDDLSGFFPAYRA